MIGNDKRNNRRYILQGSRCRCSSGDIAPEIMIRNDTFWPLSRVKCLSQVLQLPRVFHIAI